MFGLSQIIVSFVCSVLLLEGCRPGSTSEVSCFRPYSMTSIWNISLDWDIARIHSQSDSMVAAFFADSTWIGTDTSQFAPNIYFADTTTPLVPVKLRQYSFRDASNDIHVDMGEPGGVVYMPIPANARPAPGTDGQLVVINLDNGDEWGLAEAEVTSAGIWYADGAYRYHIRNSGIPPKGFAQRGAGIGELAGIVRECEIARGYIGHAVTLAYDYPCSPETCRANGWPDVIPPFTKTDGKGHSKNDIPEGARLAIRPEITRGQIVEACAGVRGCILWSLNMQKYGGFIVDGSGHPKTYAEGDATAKWDSDVWSKNMLQNLPSEWFVVIDWNFPSTRKVFK